MHVLNTAYGFDIMFATGGVIKLAKHPKLTLFVQYVNPNVKNKKCKKSYFYILVIKHFLKANPNQKLDNKIFIYQGIIKTHVKITLKTHMYMN